MKRSTLLITAFASALVTACSGGGTEEQNTDGNMMMDPGLSDPNMTGDMNSVDLNALTDPAVNSDLNAGATTGVATDSGTTGGAGMGADPAMTTGGSTTGTTTTGGSTTGGSSSGQ